VQATGGKFKHSISCEQGSSTEWTWIECIEASTPCVNHWWQTAGSTSSTTSLCLWSFFHRFFIFFLSLFHPVTTPTRSTSSNCISSSTHNHSCSFNTSRIVVIIII
jgi:hypothetical protein